MVSNELAVVIKKTLDKSNGVPKKWSVNLSFWLGSRTSSNALPGSPLTSLLNLSISSNKKTGLFDLIFLSDYIITPGIDPM